MRSEVWYRCAGVCRRYCALCILTGDTYYTSNITPHTYSHTHIHTHTHTCTLWGAYSVPGTVYSPRTSYGWSMCTLASCGKCHLNTTPYTLIDSMACIGRPYLLMCIAAIPAQHRNPCKHLHDETHELFRLHQRIAGPKFVLCYYMYPKPCPP